MNVAVPDHVRPVLDRAAAVFARQFGRAPGYAAQAPGRVNLIGEHTDYNDGFALPMAIERCCVVVAAEAQDPARSRIYADALADMTSVDLRGHLVSEPVPMHASTDVPVKSGIWTSHILGVAAQFQSQGVSFRNIDAVIATSVPLGGGLSSSAALEVAFAVLLSSFSGHHVLPAAMAKMCQTASHQFVGVPCGIMDQFASAAAEEGRALLIDCQDNTYRSVTLPPREQAVIVIADTGVKHSHAGGEYAQRAAACKLAAKVLGVPSLRHVRLDALEGSVRLLGPELGPLVAHVVSEDERTRKFIEAFVRGDLPAAGRAMFESHESLRTLYRVSCPELDQMVHLARNTPGVFGARMTGGGFGGCIVALVTPESAPTLIDTLKRQYTSPGGAPPVAFATRAAGGAGSIELS